jgi:two-component system, chemotaxis family, chemotaxis protein CheY
MQTATTNGELGHAPLRLPEVLDLAAAEEFLELMRHSLKSEEPLCIDASNVETLTLPCIQIILVAARANDRMSIKNPSIAFVSAFEALGIDWTRHLTLNQSTDQTSLPDQNGIGDQSAERNPETHQQRVVDDDAMGNESSHLDLQQMSEPAMMKRILTIDDSKTMRDMLMLTLADAGFDVLQAVDGQDGLDVLGKERVDVVITDINMPRMDGYEVIRQMRSSSEFKTVPILVLTTESEAQKKNLAREAGATGWMVKPFDPDRLIATVRKVAP